ncbi:molybdate ABC transporter substrate-binding protein [Fictibacillus sp. b24]|nr:molybdate ABC transporter substrate-binding protein [Fictibacillus sp. b24]MDM5317139.1 molybdate ABC transporter substrate-binding protein [Fictibacillus sp. b24]
MMICLTMLIVLLTACGGQGQDQSNKQKTQDRVELTISAAASLQYVLNEIAAVYEKEHPNVKITYNFGASGALQQQIAQGAPVDLFFSAAEDKYDELVKEGFIEGNSGTDLLRNELVLIVSTNSKINGFGDLPKADRISIGTPVSVPAGTYAKETLESLNLWNEIEKKMVYAKDVRQVLTYVETGNVDAGIVYKTDAVISDKVKIAATASEQTHSPIVYPVGVTKESSHQKEAKEFYEFLKKEESIKVFEDNGFKRVEN